MKPKHFKRFVKANVRRLKVAGMLAGLAVLGLAGCKAKPKGGVQLKGLFGEELQDAKTVDYAAMFRGRDAAHPLRITHLYSYESVYELGKKQRRLHDGVEVLPVSDLPGLHAEIQDPRQRPQDDATTLVYHMLEWIEQDMGKQGEDAVFGAGRPAPSQGLEALPAEPWQVQLGHAYGRVFEFQNAAAPDGSRIHVRLEVVLGPAGYRSPKQPDQVMVAGQTAFFARLGKAFVEDDIVSYNGHIWTENSLPINPGDQVPPDRFTSALADIIRQSGTRRAPGVIFMNACYSELIEADLIGAMARPRQPDGQPGWVEPILISHNSGQLNGFPNYSNYKHFTEMNTALMVEVMSGASLPQIILRMTPADSYRSVMQTYSAIGAEGGFDSNNAETAQAARDRLAEYRKALESIQNPKERTDKVLLVAYDISDDRYLKMMAP
jgi:hypothetical protein